MTEFLFNKKANFDYELLERFEAGIELLGFEVKSLKNRHGSLVGAHTIIRGGEAFLVGMQVPPYQVANTPAGYDPDRTRRLLLTKKEIATLAGWEAKKGFTIVPLRAFSKKGRIKIELAIARGKKKYDKRASIRKREDDRQRERVIKGLRE